jgi:NADH-quinone oxidoreductase subunit L
MTIPLIVLAVLSIFGGYIGVPEFMGKVIGIHDSNLFEKFVSTSILLDGTRHIGPHLFGHWTLVILSIAAALLGILIAFYLYYIKPSSADKIAENEAIKTLYEGSLNKWYVDELYDYLIVRPFSYIAEQASNFDQKFIDGAVNGVASILKEMALTLQAAQSGALRSYASLMAIGAAIILIFIVLWQF